MIIVGLPSIKSRIFLLFNDQKEVPSWINNNNIMGIIEPNKSRFGSSIANDATSAIKTKITKSIRLNSPTSRLPISLKITKINI